MTAEWWRPMGDIFHQDVFSTYPTFSQNISSYFKRPSKVTKPSSRNQSPRNKSRRRMTTQFPVRTRSVVDMQRNGTTSEQQQFDNAFTARPLSWHPTFTDESFQYQDPGQSLTHSYKQPSQYTTFAYGLVTPITYPTEVEPHTDCATIPLDQLTEQDYHYFHDGTTTTSYYRQSLNQDLATYTPMSATPMETMEYANLPWPSVPYVYNYNLATAPASPNYLPVPDVGQPFDFPEIIDAENEKEELVGMGLYDSPDQAQSSLLFSGSSSSHRKSLKLEESFEPPPEDCDADDAESESVDGEEDISSQEELNHSRMTQINQQLQPISNYSDQELVYLNTQPYFTGDLTSSNFCENIGGNGSAPYGWV